MISILEGNKALYLTEMCSLHFVLGSNPTTACSVLYICPDIMPTSLATEVSNLQKRIAAKEAKYARLMALQVRPLRHEINALKMVLRAREKRVARKKIGSDGRGRKARFPGKCMACCKRWLGEPGGCAHNLKLCAKSKCFLKKGGLRK